MREYDIDSMIADSLTKIIDAPMDIDIEEKWNDFEKRIAQKNHKKYRNHFVKIVAVVAITILTIPLILPDKVDAFKNDVFEWFNITSDNTTIITETQNPEIKPGKYSNISFEEANNLTLFNLKYPKCIPSCLQENLIINAEVNPSSKTVITILIKNEDKCLIIRQEKLILHESSTTYVPENEVIEKINIDGKVIKHIKNEQNHQYFWTLSSVQYTLMSKNIPHDEMIKVIEGLK